MTGAWMGSTLRHSALFIPGLVMLSMSNVSAQACGAYFARQLPAIVATANAQLYNHSTDMIVARVDATTTITMTADYRGEPKDFAVVIAVPTVLVREQIKTANGKLIDLLDRLTAPRLTELYDPDPCPTKTKHLPGRFAKGIETGHAAAAPTAAATPPRLGVTVEARYLVGEYDITILSAQQSDGLRIWLNEAGYNVPEAAAPVLAAYIADGMKFFVAKVNLQKQQELGFAKLQPLQISYQSPKFVVPVRLSTINADGPQEMFIYLLTKKGRVETTNYPVRTVPTHEQVPPFVKSDFAAFYRAMFETEVRGAQGRAIFIEHVSVMPKLAPRGTAVRPQENELTDLGVSWSGNVVLTRLHVRYDAEHFKNDLLFSETNAAAPFSSQFTIHHPYEGDATCPEGERYLVQLKVRQAREVANLARLTGWSLNVIREKAKPQ
jgi:hypothetical protein